MRRFRLLPLLALPLLPAMATTTADARTITWSGRTWDVRPPGTGGPGPNRWSDSTANVAVDGSDLVLSIVKDASGRWTSSEVDGRESLGYGTYRWVVESDLSSLDSHEVLGMFTYGDQGPSHNEIDIEPSHWGNPSWPTGSGTVWHDSNAGRKTEKTFEYSDKPPYVNQFTWAPGSIHWVVTDATGAKLFDWTVTKGVPTPADEVPVVNYWRYLDKPPASVRSMRLSSFRFLPPGFDPATPPPSSAGSATPVTEPTDTRQVARPDVVLKMRHRRLAGGRRSLVVRWRSTGGATLQLTVQRQRRGGAWKRVAVLRRTVTAGTGRVRLHRTVGGRRLRAGRYRLVVRASSANVSVAPSTLRFSVGR